MLIAFVLTMPNCNTWNGRWSGQDNLYARVYNTGVSKKRIAKAEEMVKKGRFYYDFGDGWTACITTKEITKEEARTIRRETKGFCGYDWMIDSIKEKLAIES